MTNRLLLDVLVQKNDELVDYISYRFGDRQFAQDIVQETCIRVLQTANPLQQIHSPIAFLKTICLRAAIDAYRKEKHINDWVDICDDWSTFSLESNKGLTQPELLVAKQQRTQLLLDAIQQLPLCYRDVFILTQLYHYPQHEVAEQLNISRGMVARHLAKALKIIQPIIVHEE
ncbi:hypothetical protein GWI33_009908 [Rhynchophorus ferrugineus]|uniref:RNA polymerase sigma factor n=1 Tax=Rhynchophorus ferrugineus TaxID=354439 RepID=A0A834I9X2_RHYFE|nr:hypothetical protein GWI33_009908 [Rhynchophorus ferrugineus]